MWKSNNQWNRTLPIKNPAHTVTKLKQIVELTRTKANVLLTGT